MFYRALVRPVLLLGHNCRVRVRYTIWVWHSGRLLKAASSFTDFYKGSLNYLGDDRHYMLSSSQPPSCVVEVGSINDTAQVVRMTVALYQTAQLNVLLYR